MKSLQSINALFLITRVLSKCMLLKCSPKGTHYERSDYTHNIIVSCPDLDLQVPTRIPTSQRPKNLQ